MPNRNLFILFFLAIFVYSVALKHIPVHLSYTFNWLGAIEAYFCSFVLHIQLSWITVAPSEIGWVGRVAWIDLDGAAMYPWHYVGGYEMPNNKCTHWSSESDKSNEKNTTFYDEDKSQKRNSSKVDCDTWRDFDKAPNDYTQRVPIDEVNITNHQAKNSHRAILRTRTRPIMIKYQAIATSETTLDPADHAYYWWTFG